MFIHANKISLLTILLLSFSTQVSARAGIESDCLEKPFDRSSWFYDPRKAQTRLMNNDIFSPNKKGGVNDHLITDAYTRKLHPLVKKDEHGQEVLNINGAKMVFMEVDHVIPLKFMHEHGGCRWTPDKKRAFANDPLNLKFTTITQNRSKGSKGPEQWLPEGHKARLRYLKYWRAVADKYDGVPKYNRIYGANILRAMRTNNPTLFARTSKLLTISGRAVVVIGALQVTYMISKEGLEYYKEHYASEDELDFSLITHSEEEWLESQVY